MRSLVVMAMLCGSALTAQDATVTPVSMIRISGSLQDTRGVATNRLTFRIYSEANGGVVLWKETQNVTIETGGRYSALLGSADGQGVPQDAVSGGARWLSVQRGDGDEGSRMVLSRGTADAAATAVEPPRTVMTAPRAASGTTNFLALFTDGAGDLGNSVLYQNGGKIGLNTTAPFDYMHVAFSDSTGGVTGYAVQNLAANANSYSGMLFYDQNGNLGQFQGFNNSTHEYRINNIASGGSINFMLLGNSKFQVRSDGDLNIAGSVRKGGTLFLHNIGTQNLAAGLGALASVTGSGNTAIGYQALAGDTSGSNNTAIGVSAGSNLTTSSNNIMIGNSGTAGDSGVIRIGTAGTQNRAFIAGIRGITTANGDAIPVMIDTNGQLGTVASSRRFKTDIEDMGDASADLFKLRPVTFHYKERALDRLEYGLIAEEVADVYPELVVKGADGRVETVQYYKLTPMLLNELQKDRSETMEKLRERQEQLNRQLELNRSLEERLAALEALLAKQAH